MTKVRVHCADRRGLGGAIARGRSRLPVCQGSYAERPGASEDALLDAEEISSGTRSDRDSKAKLKSAEQFAAWITHEVNQPISAIVTNGDAALRWLAKDNPDLPEAQAAITRMIRDANRAGAVIFGARAMLARDTSDFHDVDLNEVVKDVIMLTQGEQRRSDVIVHTALLPEIPTVKGDRIQLQQVVLNLMLNAMDAMKPVNDRPRVLQIMSGVDPTGDVVVAIEDCGVGIDPDDADRVFDHFFTTKADGMGLGLAISRSIMAAHAGRLWASPASPNGAVFQFTVPRSAAPRRDGLSASRGQAQLARRTANVLGARPDQAESA